MDGKEIEPVFFNNIEVRRVYYEKQWYFSVTDIVGILTESLDARDYWYKIKSRELENGVELSTICRRLKLRATDGKSRETDCANMEGIFRIIQSIPSKKVEQFKLWLARVGRERIEEIQNPELAMTRMKALYKAKGYSPEWIEKRARGIAIRNELTDEWKDRGISHSLEFALLTNEIMQGTFDMKVADYKKFKCLKKENLRDHMDDMELIFTMLAEATTTRITKNKNSHGFPKLKNDASMAGRATGEARKKIEEKIGEKISTPKNHLPKKVQIK